MSRQLRTRARHMCSRHGCGRVACWESTATGIRYCCDHAADLAATVVFRLIESYDAPVIELTVIHGEAG